MNDKKNGNGRNTDTTPVPAAETETPKLAHDSPEAKALFLAYRAAEKEQEKLQKAVSDAAKAISEKVGNGPWMTSGGKQVSISRRGDMYFMKHFDQPTSIPTIAL